MEASSSRVLLLGVPIDAITAAQAIGKSLWMLGQEGQFHIMTPNSEMLVESTKNPLFLSVLQNADLNLPDSIGLIKMAKCTKQHLPERVAGVDFVEALCSSLSSQHTVFLLGGRSGVGMKARDALLKQNPNLNIVDTYEGSPKDTDAEDIIHRVHRSGAKILLVAYGAPQQDLWIAKHLSKMPTVKIAIGVGGTFDFISGSIQRAPASLRSCGLEWLWRLCKQPKRIGRIFNAVVVFPFLVLRHWQKHLHA